MIDCLSLCNICRAKNLPQNLVQASFCGCISGRRVVTEESQQFDLQPRVSNVVIDIILGVVSIDDNLEVLSLELTKSHLREQPNDLLHDWLVAVGILCDQT